MKQLVKELIENKKIAILGFGREGKSTLKYLFGVGGYESITILDKNMKEAYTDDEGRTVEAVSGEAYQQCMDEYDIVFKSPGVVLEREFSEYKCEIVCQTELFMRRFREQTIGITGTKGKSTTTTLIYHILKESGKNVKLAGNVGIPSLDIADEVETDTIVVYELSSHMLEYMTVSPRISSILNIYEEHLDHYGTMEKYVAAKMNILKNQKDGDICFLNESIEPFGSADIFSISIGDNKFEKFTETNEKTYVGVVDISDDIITYTYNGNVCEYHIPVDEINLMGVHNYFDIGVAYGILKQFDITDEEFENGLKTYNPLPHRLQYIGEVGGVKYYNDSISTICETTIQAVETVPDATTVIIGGMDRGIDYSDLEKYIVENTKLRNVVLMYETGKRINDELLTKYGQINKNIHLVDDLKEAVKVAVTVTAKGKACIMSPAAASYGYFTNFEQRGQEFVRIVNGYK